MLFVDTGAWFALSVPSDPDHTRAKVVLDGGFGPLLTTDYVIDELLTLFLVRRQRQRAVDWLHDVLGGGATQLVRIEPVDFDAACHIFERFSDKAWSFTDCTSYVVMQRLRIAYAFSFDEHFREFGIVTVVP